MTLTKIRDLIRLVLVDDVSRLDEQSARNRVAMRVSMLNVVNAM